jgi:hypothetical protein
MYIAYSALRDANELPNQQTPANLNLQNNNPQLNGYLAACAKYRTEIAAIQQYLPGWMPSPPAL